MTSSRRASIAAQTGVLVLTATVLWLVIGAIVGMLVLRERDATLQRAMRSSAALALVLEEHTARTFEAVDITLGGITDLLNLTPGLQKNDAMFQRMLTRRLQALEPYARSIFVIGADGWITHDTDYPATPHVTLADRAYFRAYRDDAALERAISSPLLSRSGLGWFVPVSRRIGVDGKFNGIVVAAVQPKYFETLYRRMGLGSGDVMSLYTRDGVLIARHPGGEEAMGTSFSKSTIFSKHLPASPAGSYLAHSGAFRYERVVSYRALESVPMVVVVGQSTASLLGGWWRSAVGAAFAMGVLALLLAGLIVQFVRQQRAREREQQRVAQMEKFEALGQLTSGIAHDFANLLNIIATNLQMIVLAPTDEARTRNAAAVAQRAVARGTHLIDRLRAFATRKPLDLRPADLNAVIRDSSELLRQAVRQRAELVSDLAGELSSCLADESELEVALVNLVVNARDAGARRIEIRTYNCTDGARPPTWRHERPYEYVCLSVRDDGSGMSEEVRRRALEPFYTTKGEGGTGLGLAQVYAFMQQIGGDVSIESAVGSGTTVHLLFRRAKRGSDRERVFVARRVRKPGTEPGTGN